MFFAALPHRDDQNGNICILFLLVELCPIYTFPSILNYVRAPHATVAYLIAMMTLVCALS